MHYSIIAICLICVFIVIYLLTGVVTTCYIRAANSLKRLEYSSKAIFLTFDDGIDPAYTPLLLDLLKQYKIKASFFILASSVNDNLNLLHRMQEEGHLIGLHSYNHKNQILQSPFGLKRDFKKSMDIFREAGVGIAYYRPPWGHVRPLGLLLCKFYQLKIVLWNVIIQDWLENATAEILCNKLNAKVNGNSVICLHDGRGKNEAPLKTIETLKIMLPIWRKEGFTFETVDRLFKKCAV